MAPSYCANTPLVSLCIRNNDLTIKFNRSDTAREVKREVELETCSRLPDKCKHNQRKVNILFGSGLKIPVKKIAGVAMYDWTNTDQKERGGEILVEFGDDLIKKMGGRERIRLAGFHPRSLERVVKELIPIVEKNKVIPPWISIDRIAELADSSGVVHYMVAVGGGTPKLQSVFTIKSLGKSST